MKQRKKRGRKERNSSGSAPRAPTLLREGNFLPKEHTSSLCELWKGWEKTNLHKIGLTSKALFATRKAKENLYKTFLGVSGMPSAAGGMSLPAHAAAVPQASLGPALLQGFITLRLPAGGNDTPIPQNTPLCFPGNSQTEYRQEFPAGAASLALSSGQGPRLSGTPSSGLPGTSGVLFVCHAFISKQYLECSGLL